MKAQISLDLIMAITFALVVVGTIGVVSNEATEEQRQAVVRQQLDTIGTGLASVISVSRALNDAESAEIEFDVPKIFILSDINVMGEGKPQPCNIAIAGNRITLSYDLYNLDTGIPETISVSKEFAAPAGMTVQASQCGKPLVITNG